MSSRRKIQIYLLMLFVLVVFWVLLRADDLIESAQRRSLIALLGIITLYFISHVFRMLRLALLTLDIREKIFPLVVAHALTAFPSSFLPFKMGEIFRLIAFFHVFDYRRKALAVWLAERFGDILVITVFILGMYAFNVTVSPAMRWLLFLFLCASGLGLLALFSIAKILVYLNRHLILISHSSRGLLLLRTSYMLRGLEVAIYKSVEGRLSGFFLLSVLIWLFEIIALSLFINFLTVIEGDFAAMFVSGLLASLPGGQVAGASAFALYQSFALVILTIVFLLCLYLVGRLKRAGV